MTWSFICWEMMTPEFGTWQPLLSAGTHLFSYCIVYLTYLVYIGLCCRRAHFELVLSFFFSNVSCDCHPTLLLSVGLSQAGFQVVL